VKVWRIVSANWLAIAFAVASFAFVAFVYPSLPDPVPTHWNWRGEVDGYIRKPWGPLVVPLIQVATIVLLGVLPHISPREMKMDAFAGAYRAVITTISVFFFFLVLVTCLVGRGLPVDMNQAVSVASGVLFVVLGNVMTKFRRNFFAGIRTPWTLSNDEVWYRTHRLGGKLFVLSGLCTIAGSLAGLGLTLLLVTLFATVLVVTVYSYVVYKALEVGRHGAP